MSDLALLQELQRRQAEYRELLEQARSSVRSLERLLETARSTQREYEEINEVLAHALVVCDRRAPPESVAHALSVLYHKYNDHPISKGVFRALQE